MYRQGDVLLIPTNQKPEGDRVPLDNNRVVLAYGEATGHAHAIRSKYARLFAVAVGVQLLELRRKVTLRHEEHAPVNLPAGNYLVRRQREYTPKEIRWVAD